MTGDLHKRRGRQRRGTGFGKAVREDLVDGSTSRPGRRFCLFGDAAQLPPVAGFHIGVLSLAQEGEGFIGCGDAEEIEIQARLQRKLAGPGLIGRLNRLAVHGNLCEERPVLPQQTAQSLPGLAMLGNLHPKGTGLAWGDGSEGIFIGEIAAIVQNAKHKRSSLMKK